MRVTRIQLILLCLFALFTNCLTTTNSTSPKTKFKIAAVFVHLGKSHFDVFRPLIEELARRGHEVTVVSHFPRTEKAIAKEPLPTYKDVSLVDKNLGAFINVVDLKFIDHSFYRVFKDMLQLNRAASSACRHALHHPGIKRLMESDEKFDLVLTESFNTDCFMPVIHKLNAPFIQISSHQLMPWAVDHLGISNEASYIPAIFSREPRPMNFIGRVCNVLMIWLMTTVYSILLRWSDSSIAKEAFGPDIPNIEEVSRNVSLMLVNTHYTLHGAQLYPPNVIEVGGLHIPPHPNPLPKDLAKFLDDAHEGVLYFNLGSMVKASSMTKEMLQVLLKVFASIPRKVIWKWEEDNLPQKSSNVLIKTWLPQFDVLNHPNVKGYFGHGGLLGLSEAVHTGVPMILMPLYGDQYQNAMVASARGVAMVLHFTEFTEQTLRHALDELFNNTMYIENVRKLSKAYRDRPVTPLETAVWWTEYVARGNGLPYLRTDGSKMPWYQRNLVDVAAFVIAIAVGSLYAVYRVAKYLLSRRKTAKSVQNGIASKKRD